MKIPQKIKIGGKTYEVSITENLTLGCDYSGEILYNDLKINIRPSATAKMEADFIHELIHGIYAHLGYSEHDEKHIEELAEALYAVIVDNPDLFTKDNNEEDETP